MFFKKHLFNVFLVVLAIIIIVFVMLVTHIIVVEGIWFVFPIGNLRISTMITIVFCFTLVLFLQGKFGWRPLYYALLAVVFFLGFYEIVWYNLAVYLSGFELRIFEFAALAGWVLLCIREVYPKRPPKLSIVLYGLFVVSMVLWVATGFEVNYLGNVAFSITGEIFNVTSKAALAVAFAIHIGTKRPALG